MTDARAIERAVERRLVAGMLVGAAVIGGWGLAPPEIVAPAVGSGERILINLAGAAGFGVVVVLPWARLVSRRLLAPLRAWIDSDRSATDADRAILLAQPLRQAIWCLPWWVLTAVWIPVLNTTWVYEPSSYPLLRVQLQIAVGAFLSFAITVALVEEALRPLFARALAGSPARVTQANGLRVRALLWWGTAAGAPLASMAILISGLDGEELILARDAIYLMSVIAVLVGGAVSFLGSRPVISGLNAVHAGVSAVAHGDLDVRLQADTPSEIGRLQSGFNRMVDQLRERRRIEELFGTYVGAEAARLVADLDTDAVTPIEVTVLVTDIIGSSKLALQLDANEVVTILNEFFEEVVGAVSAEEGWVARFEGDGAVCVFGAPLPTPDHAARARRAAHDLRARTVALAERRPHVDAAIGIASGQVVAATVGAVSRSEYSVIGPPVLAAAEMCDRAKRLPDRVAIADQ